MVPELVDFGGHENFEAYKELFAQVYLAEPIHDVRGELIVFGDARFNGEHDCAHACYGGKKQEWHTSRGWKPVRAARLLWIKAVLTSPQTSIHISHDAAHPKDDARCYLWAVYDENSEEYVYHCVVATLRNGTLYFQTHYDLTQAQWQNMREKYKREYPAPGPKKKKRPKEKKGTP